MTMDRIISADSHVQEPSFLYEERVDARYRHRTPHIETREDGQYRIVEGKRPRRLDVAEARLTEEDHEREFRHDNSGGRNIAVRLADQERDGVSGEVIYPNQSLALYNSPDPGYQMAIARAYNDWAIELFGAHPERFAPVAIVPVADIPAAVAEATRVARLGYRTIKIPITMKDRPYNLPDYEPFWSAVDEAGLVVSLHAFTSEEDHYPEDWGTEEGVGGGLTLMALSMAEGQDPVTRLISGGVLQRHPRLRFVVVECGAGWLAWLLYAMDEQVKKKHMWIRPRLDLLPSEYFRRQGHVTFGDDPVALRLLEFTGADSLLWGSDYPHDEGTFPHSREVIDRTFQGVAVEDRRKIIGGTAARLYRFAS
ncbi:MAG TPA: amidohydrolase family protein [Candidatus Methylomirabilis sp.]|nr:amidohydrolase family protein [Candidatus Methylomirabilis sp.]